MDKCKIICDMKWAEGPVLIICIGVYIKVYGTTGTTDVVSVASCYNSQYLSDGNKKTADQYQFLTLYLMLKKHSYLLFLHIECKIYLQNRGRVLLAWGE